MSSQPAAKFFVNQGVVSSRADMLHLLRPLLKQTVGYRYVRGREVVAHGTGWVERIVVDRRRHLDLLHAARDHPQHRLLRASRVRDAARPAARLHPRPGRRARRRRVRADRSGRRDDRRPSPRVSSSSTPATTSRWSCSASKPTRTSSGSGGPAPRSRSGGRRAIDGGRSPAVMARSEPAPGARRARRGQGGGTQVTSSAAPASGRGGAHRRATSSSPNAARTSSRRPRPA